MPAPALPASSAEHPTAPAGGGLDDVNSQADSARLGGYREGSPIAGTARRPAELLQYTSYYIDHVEDDDGNMMKVWMLAPLLTSMLNAFFLGGQYSSMRQLGASHTNSQ